MYNYETRKNTDSVLVVNGKFKFAGSVDAPVVRRLVLNRLYANIILENGKITVDMGDPMSAKGTPLNDELSKYNAEFARYEDEAIERITEIQYLETDEQTRQKMAEEFIKQYYKSHIEPLCIRFINANRNNALGAWLLWQGPIFHLNPDLGASLYAQAGDIVRNFQPLQSVIETITIRRRTAEGMPFVDFTIENGNIDGSRASFSDYVGRGKYVLVDFWASWCGPCIAEIPTLVEVYNKYKGDEFEILGVAVFDRREETLRTIRDHKLPWAHIIDASDIPSTLYGFNSIPQIMLFAPDGTIVARDLHGSALKAKVEEVMNEEEESCGC